MTSDRRRGSLSALDDVDAHGRALRDQPHHFGTLAARVEQPVGDPALDRAGDVAHAAIGALLQRVDRVEQDRRVNAAVLDRQAELPAEAFDFERDPRA